MVRTGLDLLLGSDDHRLPLRGVSVSVERLETLLAEASPHPWGFDEKMASVHSRDGLVILSLWGCGDNGYRMYGPNRELAALAPTLARLVIDMAAELRGAHDALDDAIKVSVNCPGADWDQDDYDRWDAARTGLAALLGRVDALNEQDGG